MVESNCNAFEFLTAPRSTTHWCAPEENLYRRPSPPTAHMWTLAPRYQILPKLHAFFSLIACIDNCVFDVTGDFFSKSETAYR